MVGLSKDVLFWILIVLVPCLYLQPCKCSAFVPNTTPKVRLSSRITSYLEGSRAVHEQVPFTNQYSTSPLDKGGGALYRQSVFTKEEYSAIQKEVSSLITQLNEETTSSVAHNRLGASLPRDSDTYRILQEGSLCKLVQQLAGDPTIQLSSNLPVEVRLYEKFGAGMAWHEDDVLYDPPQVEIVMTLENNSDCVTMWKDGDKLKCQETDPNSVLLLKAGGPSHCVTPLKRGRRLILKCAYATTQATFCEGIHNDQFGMSKKKGKKRRKKK